jgi:predicted alpha/beta hydrolase family esterase
MSPVVATIAPAYSMRESVGRAFWRNQYMDLNNALRNGMRVVGSDNREYGTIERYDDAAAYIQGRRVPFAAIGHVEQDRKK